MSLNIQNMPLKMRIDGLINEMSPSEAKIAEYVLQNPKEVSRMTISDFATKLSVADSTIHQFTKKLQYSGFKEFKIALLTEEFDPNISIHSEILDSDDELSIAKHIFQTNYATLTSTEKLLEAESLKKAADIMFSSSQLVFFGLGGSNTVAYDAFHKFLRSPLNVRHEIDYHMQLMLASILKKDDCAFIISHTGADLQALQIAEIAKKSGAKIICITAYPLSPLARAADCVLVTSSQETQYRSESLASRIAQLSIIDTLYVITMFKDKERSNTSLSNIRKAISLTRKD